MAPTGGGRRGGAWCGFFQPRVFWERPPASPEHGFPAFGERSSSAHTVLRDPAPALHFVLEEAPLRRQVGGTMAWRQQLERLLEVGRLNSVTLQVMPTNSDPHPGLDGRIELLKFPDGTAVARADGLFNGRPTGDRNSCASLSCNMAASGRRLSRHGGR
jgi:Domain of unknown function (DUF5753)